MHILVYLAGSMSKYIEMDSFEEAQQWREELGYKLVKAGIDNDLDIKVFDPTDNFEVNKTSSDEGVVIQNLHYLNKADMIVCNGKYLLDSPGTIFEISHAWFNHKPVYIFGDREFLKILHLRVMCTEWFNDMDQVGDRIINLYNC